MPALQTVAVVDAMTWLVLVPLLEDGGQDPARKAYWHAVHRNWESYNVRRAFCTDFLTSCW